MPNQELIHTSWAHRTIAGKYELKTPEGDKITVLYRDDSPREIDTIVIEQVNPAVNLEWDKTYGTRGGKRKFLKPKTRRLAFGHGTNNIETEYLNGPASSAHGQLKGFADEVLKYALYFKSLIESRPEISSSWTLRKLAEGTLIF